MFTYFNPGRTQQNIIHLHIYWCRVPVVFSLTFIRIKFFQQNLVNILKSNLSWKSTHLQPSRCSMRTVRQAHVMQLTFLFETSQSASKNATLTQFSLYMPLVMKSVTWETLSWNTKNCGIKYLCRLPDVGPVILCIAGLLPQIPNHFATFDASLTNFSVFLTHSHDFN
jgi:hypothetical protein